MVNKRKSASTFVPLTTKRINQLIGKPGSVKRKRADALMKQFQREELKTLKAKGFILKKGVGFIKKSRSLRSI